MTFEEAKAKGKLGEAVTFEYLLSKKSVRDIVDARDDKRSQLEDVDFLFTVNGQIYKAEVKTDFAAYRTGNIAYEVTSFGKEGCLSRTKADYIFYYCCDENTLRGTLWIVIMAKLRTFVNDNKFTEIEMGDHATGYLIPIAELERQGICTKLVSS